MSNYYGGKKETDLVASTTFDFVRVIKDSASRRITLTNFVAAIKQPLIDIGFLTTSNLPVSVVNTRVYRETATNQALLITDDVLGVDTSSGNVTINLLLATDAFDVSTSKGQMFTIKNVTDDANKVVVNTSGGDLIEGTADIELQSGSFPYINLMAKSTTEWILV